MKEIDMRVRDSELAIEWFKNGLFSLNDEIDSIEDKNRKYGFNFKNRNENLTEEELVAKMSIKYNNICVPIAMAVEHMMKAVLIGDKFVSDRPNFNRQSVVSEIMRNVRNSYRKNGHDFEALIRYIETTIDPNFSQNIATKYAAIRGDTRFYDTRLSRNSVVDFTSPEERLEAATREYTQGFIEFRYLYEKDEQYLKNVDLIKLIHYALAIQEACLGLLKRMHLVSSFDTSSYMLASVPKKSVEDIIEEEKKKEVKDAISILIEEAAKEGVDLTRIIQKANSRYIQDIEEPCHASSARNTLLEYGIAKPERRYQRPQNYGGDLRAELEKLFNDVKAEHVEDENIIKL